MELREYFVKRRGAGDIGIRIAMDLRCTGRDRTERIHHRVEAIHDLAIHDARRADLHDAARRDVVVSGFEIKRDVAVERPADVFRVQELERFEDGERIGVDDCAGGCDRQSPIPSGCQHSPQRDFDSTLRCERDVVTLLDLLSHAPRFRKLSRVAQLIVPFFQHVLERPDALRQDLLDDVVQGTLRPTQTSQILYLESQPPQLLGVGIVSRPALRERAHLHEEVPLRTDRRLDFLQEVL